MSVVFDAVKIKSAYNVTSLTTEAFTISANANRAALACLHPEAVTDFTGDAFSGTCGGQALSVQQLYHANLKGLYLLGGINPASGSQTASMSWETVVSAWFYMGVMTFTGAAQSSTFDGIQTDTEGWNATALSLAIISDSGDLTASFVTSGIEMNSNQTERYDPDSSGYYCGDTGPGTGNTTHTWTPIGSQRKSMVGININQVAAGGISIPVAMQNMRGGFNPIGMRGGFINAD